MRKINWDCFRRIMDDIENKSEKIFPNDIGQAICSIFTGLHVLNTQGHEPSAEQVERLSHDVSFVQAMRASKGENEINQALRRIGYEPIDWQALDKGLSNTKF